MKLNYLIFVVLTLLLSTIKAKGQLIEEGDNNTNYCHLGKKFLSSYQFEKAIESLNICYQNDTQNLNYLKNIAFCHYKLGRLKDAKNTYLKVIELDSINLTAINHLGISYSKESNYHLHPKAKALNFVYFLISRN